ncbi:Ygp1p SCDLUD_002939 [Saccharomycodes ludwigii]|uniref:Ygp1p n=1 Tax=Saccharomycodes ludwigii TaxID=36035 RepID=UPI001E87409A|nr:hypothetical protein SCDLUD_002939 [Saccharomycodes ludwigii]KAH3901445.1 hypothetical protein SCDLUD_002939 [Saccharomycodes ludwigii]
MKFSTVLSAGLLSTVASALPVSVLEEFYKRDLLTSTTAEDVTYFNGSTPVNTTNNTGVLYTYGNHLNSTNATDVETLPFSLNSTNLTTVEIVEVAEYVEAALFSLNDSSVVVTVAEESLASTGFFLGLSYPNKTVIVSENITKGLLVAKDEASAERGALIVDASGYIYDTVSYPNCPVGVVTASEKVVFYTTPSLVSILDPRTSVFYTNAFSVNISSAVENIATVPVISYSNTTFAALLNASVAQYKGVVVSAPNVSTLAEISIPTSLNGTKVVVAVEDAEYVDQALFKNSTDVVAAGNLGPEQARVLLTVALTAGFDSYSNLTTLFP